MLFADVAGAIVEHLYASTAMMAVAQLRVLGGAMARVSDEATAFAHHAHISALGAESAPDAVQEGVGADEQTQLSGEPRSVLAAQRERDPLQGPSLAVGAAREGPGHLIQALGEDPALAGRLVAEELAHPNPQAYAFRTSARRQAW